MNWKMVVLSMVSVFTLAACGQEEEAPKVEKKVETETTKDMTKETTTEKVDEKDMVKNKGEMAPMFSLMDTKGMTVNVADYKGKKVYIKYWASWCPICLNGMDKLDMLSAEENDFVVLSIVTPNSKGEKSMEDFKKWMMEQEQKNIHVLLDEDGEIGKKFGLIGYPTSYFIGSDGVLVQSLSGHLENDMIKEKFMSIQ